MRKTLAVLIVVAAVSLTLLAERYTLDAEAVKVLVRVRGTHVHFRSNAPGSLSDRNILRYTERRETFLADARELGPSEVEGERGEWYHLTNLATQEGGWVAGAYVKPIYPEEALLLSQVGLIGAPGSSWTSLWGAVAANVLSIIASVLTIVVLCAPKTVRRPLQSKKQELPPNVISIDRQNKAGHPRVLVGTSGHTPWLYRPRGIRRQEVL